MEDYTPTMAERARAEREAAWQDRHAIDIKLYYRTGNKRFEYKTFTWKVWPQDFEAQKHFNFRYYWKAEWLTKTAKVHCITMLKGKKEIVLRGKKLKVDNCL